MIVNEEQRLAMEFIAIVNRAGYGPTASEINEWRLRPDPKPARRGKLLEPEVPGIPDRRVRIGGTSVLDTILSSSSFRTWNSIGDAITAQIAAVNTPLIAGMNAQLGRNIPAILAANNSLLDFTGDQYKTVPGTTGKPAVYGPDRPPEKFLAHLCRLGWVPSSFCRLPLASTHR